LAEVKAPRSKTTADYNVDPTLDSLQLLLHAIDEVAGPGTVARVD